MTEPYEFYHYLPVNDDAMYWGNIGDNLNVVQDGNPDLFRVQKAVWGEVGYTFDPGS